jgi:hypothetical protein
MKIGGGKTITVRWYFTDKTKVLCTPTAFGSYIYRDRKDNPQLGEQLPKVKRFDRGVPPPIQCDEAFGRPIEWLDGIQPDSVYHPIPSGVYDDGAITAGVGLASVEPVPDASFDLGGALAAGRVSEASFDESVSVAARIADNTDGEIEASSGSVDLVADVSGDMAVSAEFINAATQVTHSEEDDLQPGVAVLGSVSAGLAETEPESMTASCQCEDETQVEESEVNTNCGVE